MVGFAIALGIALLIAVAACVWLAIGRAGVTARAGAAESEVRRAGEELGRAEARAAEDRRGAEARLAALQARIDEQGGALTQRIEEIARLEEQLTKEREMFAARQHELGEREVELKKRITEINEQFEHTFKSLAQNALTQSQQQFLTLAEQRFKTHQTAAGADLDARKKAVEELVRPIGETLRKADERLGAIEKQREATFATLSEQVRASGQASEMLRTETGKLVNALRKPQVRGAYGEIQLRRVVEVAGMRNYCRDFETQGSVRDTDGRLLRPDMVVTLPSERQIVIDAKTNIGAYMEALEGADEAERERCLERFAAHVAEQVNKLAAKSYWDQFEKAPEFVVMFVPGDQFIDAALSRRPELFEAAASKRVILASPSTLIGLLRAVELGWKEQRLAEEAKELRRLGEELHDRAAKVWETAAQVGESLERTVKKYNEFVGSVEGRLTPTLRKFEEAGVRSAKALPSPVEVTVLPRPLDMVRGDG